jgi:hypothetical protein
VALPVPTPFGALSHLVAMGEDASPSLRVKLPQRYAPLHGQYTLFRTLTGLDPTTPAGVRFDFAWYCRFYLICVVNAISDVIDQTGRPETGRPETGRPNTAPAPHVSLCAAGCLLNHSCQPNAGTVSLRLASMTRRRTPPSVAAGAGPEAAGPPLTPTPANTLVFSARRAIAAVRLHAFPPLPSYRTSIARRRPVSIDLEFDET